MSDTATSWLPWRAPHTFANGVETAFHHPLIELRRPGAAPSRCVDPLDLLDAGDLSGAEWRPMIWARDGMANRRPRDEVIADNIANCEDGYYLGRLQGAFEQIYEGTGLSDMGARRWVDDVRRRQQWCAARGAVFRLFVIPDTQSIYPDKVPGCPAPSPDRPIMRILRAADPEVRQAIVYPYQQMCDGRARHETCSKDDLHYTMFGAFLCYRALMDSLPGCAPERLVREEDLVRQEGPTIGGFGYAVGLERYHAERYMPPRAPSRKLLSDPRFATGHVDVLETDAPDLPSLVTFRTSNSSALISTYYVRHFSRIVAVAGRHVLEDLIDSERPDVVVLEIAERLISGSVCRPYHDPDAGPAAGPGNTFEEFTGFKLPLPRTHPQSAGV